MGSCCSTAEKIEPEDDGKLKSPQNGTGKNIEENLQRSRSCTDVFFLILMSAFLISLVGLLIYCAAYSDIYRILNGNDDCGNVCGKQNLIKPQDMHQLSTCEGLDLTDKRYLLLRNVSFGSTYSIRKECVTDCTTYSGYRQFANRCIPEKTGQVVNTFFSKTGLLNFFQEAAEDLDMCWREVIYLCLIALAFSIVMMLFFRFFVGIIVWVVLIGVTMACIAGTIFLWILYAQKKNNNGNTASDVDSRNQYSYLAFAIGATVVTIVVALIIFVLRKRIQLIVALFKQAGKAIGSMPLLLLEPLLTFACLVVIISLWFYFCMMIQSAGVLTPRDANDLYFKKDFAMKFTRWYNLLAMLWVTQFIIGCQHMVIAGAVSTWYFTRNKDNLGLPIISSFHKLVRYHLGSVAFGSLIIAVIQFIRVILKAIQTYLQDKTGKCAQYTLTCCQCCLACFEKILKYLSRNAYIEVAMYSVSFCEGGKQAFKLLVANGLRVAVINSVGDFVLFLGKVLVVLSTVLIGIEMLKYKEGIQHMWVPIGIAGLFAYFISHCFLTVYEMAIDTIFLCFCEDSEQNDGISRPYYMPAGLMEFVENSRKALYVEQGKGKGREQAWQERPATISDKVEN